MEGNGADNADDQAMKVKCKDKRKEKGNDMTKGKGNGIQTCDRRRSLSVGRFMRRNMPQFRGSVLTTPLWLRRRPSSPPPQTQSTTMLFEKAMDAEKAEVNARGFLVQAVINRRKAWAKLEERENTHMGAEDDMSRWGQIPQFVVRRPYQPPGHGGSSSSTATEVIFID